MTPEGILKFVKENDIEIVDLKFNDLPGLWQHFSIPASELTDIDDPTRGIWVDGIGFDTSSIRGFQKIQESDMILLPDPETAVIDPICEVPTLSIICDIYDPLTKEPYTRDPRYIAKKAEKYLKSTGIADISYWGPEMEFFIFDDIRFDQNQRCGFYYIDSVEAAWNTGREENPDLGYKPRYFEDNGSGMHVHQSLFKDGKNIFFDPQGYALISQTAKYYIGGLLKHSASLSALVAPTTNSYRWLVPGFEAPVNLIYSARNRSACVRIPVYTDNPRTKRIEYRPPDNSCNGYLALAAMLMAGLDGIENQIDPGEPLDKDSYHLSPEEAAKIQTVPSSLEEALDALEKDHDYLLKGGVFTPDVIETWLEYKRTKEVDALRLRPHPYEFYLYFDI